MQKIPIYQIDAFTDRPFLGNPAAVCILNDDLDDQTLQNIAREMNLSETAFIYTNGNIENIKSLNSFRLRWMTPIIEVEMCGHATLAAAACLFNEYHINSDIIFFETLCGQLIAERSKDGIKLIFPMSPLRPISIPDPFLQALGITQVKDIQYSDTLNYALIEIASEKELRELKPDFQQLVSLETPEEIGLVIVTTAATDYDFISRCFCPWFGIEEDPVTGSAHTLLYPFWASKLQKEILSAYQASDRGGELYLKQRDEKVEILGKTKLVLQGNLML
jgi:PhzF family phenazine biosynthesis protein